MNWRAPKAGQSVSGILESNYRGIYSHHPQLYPQSYRRDRNHDFDCKSTIYSAGQHPLCNIICIMRRCIGACTTPISGPSKAPWARAGQKKSRTRRWRIRASRPSDGLFLGDERIFSHTADRTDPGIGNVFERGAWRDSAVWIAQFWVVHKSADGAEIFHGWNSYGLGCCFLQYRSPARLGAQFGQQAFDFLGTRFFAYERDAVGLHDH